MLYTKHDEQLHAVKLQCYADVHSVCFYTAETKQLYLTLLLLKIATTYLFQISTLREMNTFNTY